MSRETGPGHYRDGALVSIVTAQHKPQTDVSERTQTSYANGAALMLEHLLNGHLELSTPGAKETLGELVGRLVANARSQGVPITTYGDSFDIDSESLTAQEGVQESRLARTVADVLAHTSLADADGPVEDAAHWSDPNVLSVTRDLLDRLQSEGYTILPPVEIQNP